MGTPSETTCCNEPGHRAAVAIVLLLSLVVGCEPFAASPVPGPAA